MAFNPKEIAEAIGELKRIDDKLRRWAAWIRHKQVKGTDHREAIGRAREHLRLAWGMIDTLLPPWEPTEEGHDAN